MTARILVVDDEPADIKLLTTRLSAEYFDVIAATNALDALAVCERAGCDIVILDVMMPGMDGFDLCRRLKANPATHHIPVIMLTALDQPSDRLRGLEAGADEFLTKPVADIALIARVRSLTRLKMMTDELRLRALSAQGIGVQGAGVAIIADSGRQGRVLVVDDRRASSERLAKVLTGEHAVEIEADPNQALVRAAEGNYDLAIVSLAFASLDGLRLCSQLRSLERTRHLPILALADSGDEARMVRGLEIGVNDYLTAPIDKNELLARARIQVRKKRYNDRLRDHVQQSIEMAITDALTGLYNRRYMERHLATLVEQAAVHDRQLSVLMLDIDYFKAINDTHGHGVGDEVLRQFAQRLRRSIRGLDLACRYGGEEFIIVMPETNMAVAGIVAERLRRRTASEPFVVRGGQGEIEVTVSIGLASLAAGDGVADVLKRADQALYRAKREGRNRVVADAA